LSELTSEFDFIPISGNRNIELKCGNEDNLKLLHEAVTYAQGYEWVDLGVTEVAGTLRPVIAYGDFSKIDDYYNTTNDQRLRPVYINSKRQFDNLFDDDIIAIDSVEELDSTQGFSLVYPFANTGTNSSDNTAVVLRKTTYNFVNKQFPIVAKTSSITGETLYYVRNPFTRVDDEEIKVYEYQDASTTQTESGVFNTQVEITEEVLYKRTVAYIQAMQSQPTLSINPTYKRLIMPGTKAIVDYTQDIKDYSGQVIYTQEYKGSFIFDVVEEDLALLS
jgi:hypothetical protein